MNKLLLVFPLICMVVFAGCAKEESPTRQEAVAARGVSVMPFDLDRSTHVFEKQENGGLQQVYSDDADTAQVDLIRAHLEEIAGKFAEGNFHDPAHIHGHAMPGLHDLVMGHEKLAIIYSNISNGGQILYTTDDSSMVQAVHKWFDAQLSDHGDHAQGHH